MLTLIPNVQHFLSSRFINQRGRAPCLDLLSNDILIDHIFTYLAVEDILSLRRVSKLYYVLSHEPVIWKRFLRVIPIPIPPLPPTSRYSLPSLTGFEAERVIVRALSLDDNWRAPHPQTFRVRASESYYDVLSMCAVPGGQYMFASVCARGNRHYGIILYVCDHRTGVTQPIARMATETKAYDLRAKYMSVHGVQGIVLSYTRRYLKIAGDQVYHGINPNSYSADCEVDRSLPIVHEASAWHVSLPVLESLTPPDVEPGTYATYLAAQPTEEPFRQLAAVSSEATSISHTTVEELNGDPHLVVVAHPESIVFKNIHTGTKSTLKCTPWEQYIGFRHVIKAIRVIPALNQVLVIRQVMGDTATKFPVYPFELYNIPFHNKAWHSAIDRVWINDATISHFYISTDSIPSKATNSGTSLGDTSIQPTLPAWTLREPDPISVFCRTAKPDGLMHLVIWPRRIEYPPSPNMSPASSYRDLSSPSPSPSVHTSRTPMSAARRPTHSYPLSSCNYQSIYDFSQESGGAHFGSARIFPGAHRALILGVPPMDRTDSPRLLQMWSYASPERHDADTDASARPEDLARREQLESCRAPRRDNCLAALGVPPPVKEVLERGVSAVAWDDTIGRAFVAAADCQRIFVMDFAQAPKEDFGGQRLPFPAHM